MATTTITMKSKTLYCHAISSCRTTGGGKHTLRHYYVPSTNTWSYPLIMSNTSSKHNHHKCISTAGTASAQLTGVMTSHQCMPGNARVLAVPQVMPLCLTRKRTTGSSDHILRSEVAVLRTRPRPLYWPQCIYSGDYILLSRGVHDASFS